MNTDSNEKTYLESNDLRSHLQDRGTWMRLVFLIIFGIIFYLCSVLTFAASLLQFLSKLFTGQSIAGLVQFGDDLSAYLGQLIRYMTFASEEKPFPFSPLPKGRH